MYKKLRATYKKLTVQNAINKLQARNEKVLTHKKLQTIHIYNHSIHKEVTGYV
jgi:hypothetical protein